MFPSVASLDDVGLEPRCDTMYNLLILQPDQFELLLCFISHFLLQLTHSHDLMFVMLPAAAAYPEDGWVGDCAKYPPAFCSLSLSLSRLASPRNWANEESRAVRRNKRECENTYALISAEVSNGALKRYPSPIEVLTYDLAPF